MPGLLETLLRPDQEEDPERTLVARAANILQVGEFQLLQLAYADWYGEDLPVALCDRVFEAYMLHDEVPAWARHYARRVIEQDEAGLIDGNKPDYHRYDHDYVTHVPRGVQRFCLASMVVAVVLVGGILVGHLAGTEATSVLPPYFQPEQLQLKDAR